MRSEYSPELGTACNSAGGLEAAFSRIRAFLLIYAPTGGIYPRRRRRRPAGLRPRPAMRGGRIERIGRRPEGLGEKGQGWQAQGILPCQAPKQAKSRQVDRRQKAIVCPTPPDQRA